MGNFFNNLGEKMRTFMIDRNGPDKLGNWILGAAVILMLINLFVPNIVCSVLSYAMLFYCIYRIFSKDISSRSAENEKFTSFLERFKGKGKANSGKSDSTPGKSTQAKSTNSSKAANSGNNTSQNNDKITFTCEKCGQSLSVPKGRGTLKVTCPKCHHQTKIKS